MYLETGVRKIYNSTLKRGSYKKYEKMEKFSSSRFQKLCPVGDING